MKDTSLTEQTLNEIVGSKKTKPDEEKSKPSWKKKLYYSIFGFILVCVFSIGALAIFDATYYTSTFISGASMYPNINKTVSDEDGNIIDGLDANYIDGIRVEWGFVDTKIDLNNLKRFDLIQLATNSTTTQYVVKRLIALPNEKIEVNSDGELYINDTFVEQKFISTEMQKATGIISEQIGEDEFYVLGDYRYSSADSRNYGAFPKEQFKGKLVKLVGTCTLRSGLCINRSYYWPRYL